MNAGLEREMRLGHVMRAPAEIASDILAGARSLAEVAENWTQMPPSTPGAISSAQGAVAGLARLLIDLRAAVHAQESRAA